MGNGPSLNQMDLELFSKEYVWASNRAYLLFDRISWRPDFYTAVDRRVVPDIAAELRSLPQMLPGTEFFWPLEFRNQQLLDDARNVSWFDEELVDESIFPARVFSKDCASYVVHPRTVTITALQLAVYMGFNPIYLIGCDTKYVIPDSTKIDGLEGELLTSVANDDPNHFDPAYFGAGSMWHSPHPEKMISHYQAVKRVCETLNVEIFNATVGGMLEVFPRIDYLSVFGK